jgi:SSS family solute:Na+ symporter
MLAGFVIAVVLELVYPGYLPWAYGLTSGAVALVVNLAVYVAAAYLVPQSAAERARVDGLFATLDERNPATAGNAAAQPA